VVIAAYDSQKSPPSLLQDNIKRETKEPILLLALEGHAAMRPCCSYVRADVVVGGQHKRSCSIFKEEPKPERLRNKLLKARTDFTIVAS
jgi:hypothetical protein